MLLMIQVKKPVDGMMKVFEERVPHNYYSGIFTISYDRMKKYERTWHIENAVSVPETFFVETEYDVKAFEKLAFVYMEGTVSIISPDVEMILKKICDENHHLGMSAGVIINHTTKITEGPLVGLEKYVKKIDRHKRLSWLEFSNGDNKQLEMQAGLEIVSKC